MQTQTIGVFAAKTHLSALVEKVRHGERFTITRHGEPVAELGPPAHVARRPKRGVAKSREFRMSADFDAPLEDFGDYM